MAGRRAANTNLTPSLCGCGCGRSEALHTASAVHSKARPGYRLNLVLQQDPTRTKSLRNRFVREITKRFRLLQRVIRYAIVDADILGLEEQPTIPTVLQAGLTFEEAIATVRARMFAFPTAQAKVEAFMGWLDEMESRSILQTTLARGTRRTAATRWTDIYVDHAYQRGVRRGRQELIKAGADIPPFDPAAGDGPVRMAMNQPMHAEQLGLMYTRAFSELVGIDAAMDQAISRELAEGLAAGWGPHQIARNINDRVSAIGINRARTLARTEVIRSHHVANITEYRNWDATAKVQVKAEWATAGVNVCPICASLEDESQREPFTLDEIYGMIPAHPNCRCVAIPILQKPTEGEAGPPPTDPTVWVQSTSLKDAKGQLSKRFKLKGAQVKGAARADQLMVLNSIGEHLAATVEANPGLAEMIRLNKGITRFHVHSADVFSSSVYPGGNPFGVRGFYYGEFEAITGATRLASQPELHILMREVDLEFLRRGLVTDTLNIGRGNWIAGDDFFSIIRHEWGHHFHTRGGRGVFPRKQWDAMFAETGSEYWEAAVSKYAGTDAGEAFAEAFGALTSPVYGVGEASRLPASLEQIFEKITAAGGG